MYDIGLLGATKVISPGSNYSFSSKVYFGPELKSTLSEVATGLDLTVDYGVLWMLSNTLFYLLVSINSLVGNWGVAIILLTMLIKAAFYKLSEKSYVSMNKMKKLQPQFDSLKETYGDDKEKMSLAMRELFKKEGVNPLGGCLPTLIQIPFFMALYFMLVESVDLRHAPFFGWITDLSARDPYFVLPVLMGASMFLQQKA